MIRESANDWQRRLDDTGTVVIKSRRHVAAWTLAGCAALTLLGILLAVSGSAISIILGLVLAGAGVFGLQRIGRTVLSGRPHLVVTAERLDYGRRSVPWSAVNEVVRHSMTMRGDTATDVWILHGERDRLRLPDTLRADMSELGAWLRDVHSRRRPAA